MFEGLLLPWQQGYHLAFNSIFRTTPEVSSKFYFVEISYVSEKVWLFNHKRADFLASKFWIFFHFSASLITVWNMTRNMLCSMFWSPCRRQSHKNH